MVSSASSAGGSSPSPSIRSNGDPGVSQAQRASSPSSLSNASIPSSAAANLRLGSREGKAHIGEDDRLVVAVAKLRQGSPKLLDRVDRPVLREYRCARQSQNDHSPHRFKLYRRIVARLLGRLAQLLLHPLRHLVEYRHELLRSFVAKPQNAAREVLPPVHGDDARRHAVPAGERLRAELLVYRHRLPAQEQVAHRHAPTRIDVDDLVEGHDGIPQRLQVAPGGYGFTPPAPLEIVVDDVLLVVLAEAGGEEVLGDEDVQHVGRCRPRSSAMSSHGHVQGVGDGIRCGLRISPDCSASHSSLAAHLARFSVALSMPGMRMERLST